MPLPYHFPDPLEEARRRAVEFQRLPVDERWREIAALSALGLKMVRLSTEREAIEQRMLESERRWQEIQLELFTRHGS
jgi:hypothetical protein